MKSNQLTEAIERGCQKLDQDTAKRAYYCYNLHNEDEFDISFVGPSLQLAELLADCWGNLKHGSRPLETTKDTVSAEGYCKNLLTNKKITEKFERPILNKEGVRFEERLIQKTMKATQEMAEREAILSILPKGFSKAFLRAAMWMVASDKKAAGNLLADYSCKLVSKLQLGSFEKQQELVKYFRQKGIPEAAVYQALGVSAIEEITSWHVAWMQGVRNAIQDKQVIKEEIL